MTGRHRRMLPRLSVGWTEGRGPWIQLAGRERGGRTSEWFGGRLYLRGRRRS
jgi:hypothetical protein